ncbi:cyclic-phosphate processing receiver domain-containing protein [Rhizobium leguminosarum]|uniref:cyclic-phosphate processing receiver domain-containing protein n=1 Tax=Rhizobium leguminosarum TaxID=384 RepID=UPI002E138FF5|nr:cyclic-phosphate processing receiver domain-containing protein [Rhizobium leguminosarum]
MTEGASDWVLYLDDERTPPKSSAVYGKEVVHAKNVREFADAIRARGEPFMIFFDWYLGSGEPDGIEAAKWLIAYDREHDILTEGLMYDSQSSDKTKAREIVRLIGHYLEEKFPWDENRVRTRRLRP